MIKTVMIGKYVSVQGEFIKRTASGLTVVRVGSKVFAGRAVSRCAA